MSYFNNNSETETTASRIRERFVSKYLAFKSSNKPVLCIEFYVVSHTEQNILPLELLIRKWNKL
jgi:hypothetical protein